VLNLYSGQEAKALADVSHAAELDPKDAFNLLWVDIVGQRSKLPSRLAETAKQADLTKWPGPIVKLYLGQLTPAAVLVSVEERAGRTKKRQTCQANFYGGMWALRQDAKEEATRLLKLAANECYKTQLEWRAANAELKALGIDPAAK
jgi:lipoprotein NlpI